MKKTLQRAVPLIGLVVSMWALSRVVEVGAILEAVRRSEPGWVFCAAMAGLIATGVSALKFWRMLAHAGEPRTWPRCWLAIMYALGLNSFLPGKAGDLAKAVYLRQEGRPLSVLVGLVVLERLSDLGLLASFALVGALLVGWRGAAMASGAILAIAIAGLLLLRFSHAAPGLGERLRLAGHSARELGRKPAAAAEVLLLAGLQWQLNAVIMHFLLLAVGVRAPILATWTATPLALLAGVAPVTVSGIGTRDGVFLALLSGHASGPSILAASFLYTAVAYWGLGLVGIAVVSAARLRASRP